MTLLALAVCGVLTLSVPLRAIVFGPLPFSDPEALVVVDAPILDVYTDSFPHRESLSDILTSVAGYRTSEDTLITAASPTSAPVRCVVTGVTPEFFAVLGTHLLRGRDFARTDFAQHFQERSPVDAAVAIVGYEFWRTKLGSAKDLDRAVLTIGAARYEVVGVAPPGFGFPDGTDIWVPSRAPFAGAGAWTLIGRLRPGLSVAQTTDRLRILVTKTASDTALAPARRPTLYSLRSYLLGEQEPVLWMLWLASVLFFVLACVGVANLLWANGVRRRHEMATRMALGASRQRLVKELLSETATLAIIGTLVGYALSTLGVRAVDTLVLGANRYDLRLGPIDTVALLITVPAIAILLCGLGPSLRATNAGALTAPRVRRSRANVSTPFHRTPMSPLLAAGQLAIAMVLLVCTALLLRSLLVTLRIPLGFEPNGVILLHVDLPRSTTRFQSSQALYQARQAQGNDTGHSGDSETAVGAELQARTGDYAQHRLWYEEAMSVLRSTPGVSKLGLLFPTPFMKGGDTLRTIVPIDPLDGSFRKDFVRGLVRSISDETFAALGMHVRTGRTVLPRELVPPRPLRLDSSVGHQDVAIVNETLAKRVWPNQSPVGKELLVGYHVTVVGVVEDIRESPNLTDHLPTVYVPAFPESTTWNFVIKVRGDVSSSAVAAGLPGALMARLPTLPRPTVTFLTDQIAEPLRNLRLALYLVGCFAFLGTLVAALGVYATASEVAAARAQEMGIRVALGATPPQIRRLALWRGFRMVLLAIPVGTLGAWTAARGLSHWLLQLQHLDLLSFLGCSALLTLVAFIASLPPAFRAATIDAALVLRIDA